MVSEPTPAGNSRPAPFPRYQSAFRACIVLQNARPLMPTYPAQPEEFQPGRRGDHCRPTRGGALSALFGPSGAGNRPGDPLRPGIQGPREGDDARQPPVHAHLRLPDMLDNTAELRKKHAPIQAFLDAAWLCPKSPRALPWAEESGPYRAEKSCGLKARPSLAQATGLGFEAKPRGFQRYYTAVQSRCEGELPESRASVERRCSGVRLIRGLRFGKFRPPFLLVSATSGAIIGPSLPHRSRTCRVPLRPAAPS